MFSVVPSAGFDLGMEESDCKRSTVADSRLFSLETTTES